MTDNTLTIDNENTLVDDRSFIINNREGEGTLAGAGKLLVRGGATFDNQSMVAMTVSKPIELGEDIDGTVLVFTDRSVILISLVLLL